MNCALNNEQTKNKELVYEESFWSGKKVLKYDGVELKKISRNVFEYDNGTSKEQFEVVGNMVLGVKIKMFGSEVQVTRKVAWYELVMSLFVAMPCLILGGAIGGALGAIFGIINLFVIRNINKWWWKLLISIGFAGVSVAIDLIVVSIILSLF